MVGAFFISNFYSLIVNLERRSNLETMFCEEFGTNGTLQV